MPIHRTAVVLLLLSPLCLAAGKKASSISIHAPVDQVKAAIAAHFLPLGWRVSSENGFRLVLDKEASAGMDIMLKLAIGGAAANKAEEELTFNLSPSREDVLVTLEDAIVQQAPFGRINRIGLNDSRKQRAEQELFLAKLKAEAEAAPAASAAHKIALGIAFRSGDSMVLGAVLKGSPADIAGLAPGDLLVAMDGAPIASQQALRSRVEEIADLNPGGSLRLSYYRDGKLAETDVRFAQTSASVH